jgi:iron complex outermembrane receptor protein
MLGGSSIWISGVKTNNNYYRGGNEMKKVLMLTSTIALGFVFVLGALPSTFAQEGSVDEFTLEEITVTAQKREENLQKVPLAIESVSGFDLVELGKVDFYDALSSVTSLIMQEGTRGFVVSLRGMSNDQGGQDSPVALTIDGAYTNRQEGGSAGLLDVDRIEVLMGPQGTLHGRLATAGVVNIISKNPTDIFEAYGLLEYGNYNLLHTDGVLNVPLSESWAMRAAFRTVIRDGYLSNGENDNDEKTGRVKTSFTPNDDFKLVFTLENTRVGGRGKGSVYPFADQPANPWLASYSGTDTYRSTTLKRYGLDLDWDLGFGIVTFTPSYRDFYLDLGWILMGNLQVRHETTEELGAELRLASPDDSRIKWLAGLYYYDRDSITEAYNPPDFGRYQHGVSEDKSEAAFGNVTFPVSDRFRINGGMRYTTDSTSRTSYDITGQLAPFPPPSSDSFSNSDYKIGIEYDVSDSSMLWADFSTGFRAGKMRNKPEYLNAFQTGAKNRFLDDALQLNWSAFYYDYEGYQSEKIITYPDGSFNMGGGSGDAKLIGVDVQSNYIIGEKDRFDLSVSFLDATYKNVVVKYAEWITNPDTNLPEPDEYFGGATMTHSPEWTIGATYEHTFALQNGGTLRARVDTRFQTESSIAFAMDPRYDLDPEAINNPDHHVSNASLTYGSPDGKFSFSGYIKNIENFALKNHMLGDTMRIGSPRTYAVQLSVSY